MRTGYAQARFEARMTGIPPMEGKRPQLVAIEYLAPSSLPTNVKQTIAGVTKAPSAYFFRILTVHYYGRYLKPFLCQRMVNFSDSEHQK